jgi:hypothetical protein
MRGGFPKRWKIFEASLSKLKYPSSNGLSSSKKRSSKPLTGLGKPVFREDLAEDPSPK